MADPKLSPDQRQDILRRFAAGEMVAVLARDYKVAESTIRKLCTRRVAAVRVVNEGKEQTYRESLNWALSAAGEFLRTGQRPTTCPNDAAWFLYVQAIDEPKDFMAKVAQVEKGDNGEADRNTRLSAQRSIAEIEAMLAELEPTDG
jgi:hypothetical protein